MKVKITKADGWTNPADGKEHAKDAIVDLDDAKGKGLVALEYAEEIATDETDKNDFAASLGEFKSALAGIAKEVVDEATAGAKGLRVTNVKDLSIDEDPMQGFNSFGEFARDVQAAEGHTPSDHLQKVMAAGKASGQSEGVGAEGGFLLPTELSNNVMTRAQGVLGIMALCDWSQGIKGNSLEVVGYIDHDRSGTTYRYGGVIPYWVAEAAAITGSKLLTRKFRIELEKMGALTYLTEEMVEDIEGMGQKLEAQMGLAIGNEAVEAVMFGNGVGKPLGAFASPCRVTVAKEGGQAADTIVAENILNMDARCYETEGDTADGGPFGRWYFNKQCRPQLLTTTIDVGTGGSAVMLPMGGLANRPFDTILGAPARRTGHCAALGDVGDILVADWSHYKLVTKGNIKTSTSIHLKFAEDETAFKATFRIGGAPGWDQALTPREGADDLSPFVELAVR